MDPQRPSQWRPTRRQLLWASSIVGVVALLVTALLLIRLGYAYRWTGFGQYKVTGEVQPFKTLWDWLDLLIVPIVLALVGYLFTRSESRRAQSIAEQQGALDRELAYQRTKEDRKTADERRQDDLLQAYLDQIGQLLLDKALREAQEDDEVRTLARARTVTVLPRLDGDRKRSVLQFLYESDLIDKDRTVVNLTGADLSEADLSEAYLNETNLSEANLSEANLSEANLSEANLSEANLRGADLRGAVLSGTNLSYANLADAKVTPPEFVGVESLEGATVPNGQNFEDWLKSKDQEENKQSDGSS